MHKQHLLLMVPCMQCRQFQFRVGAGNFCSVHVSLVPVLGVVGEQKTKPTQHSVAVLRSLGINPHLLACRSSEPLEQSVKVKLVSAVSGHPPVFAVDKYKVGELTRILSTLRTGFYNENL